PIVAAVPRSVRAQSGIEIATQARLAGVAAAGAPAIDTLIVAGGRGARRAARDSSFVRLVGRAARRARRVAPGCAGAFVPPPAGAARGGARPAAPRAPPLPPRAPPPNPTA